MKFYETTTKYNCGIDLHTRQMYMCVMDQRGKKLVHTNITGNDFDYFLEKAKPYRDDLTVVCECTFNWPWLASNMTEFWNRWHMTLSGWCRAYVYMPMIGLTRKPFLAIFATFMVMGLWHAGNLHWVGWGLYQASGSVGSGHLR